MAKPFKPKGRDEDGLTYLPIDRSGAANKRYAVTDPRERTGVGGMRYGKVPVFSAEEQLPAVDAAGVEQACADLMRGQRLLMANFYLCRVTPEDVGLLLQATATDNLRERWGRLWVASAHLARLARSSVGREVLVAGLSEDLSALNLLGKLAEQGHEPVAILFKRLHDSLLRQLLGQLSQSQNDSARVMMLVSVIGIVEMREDLLRRAMPETIGPEQTAALLAMLYVRRHRDSRGRLRAHLIRSKLEGRHDDHDDHDDSDDDD